MTGNITLGTTVRIDAEFRDFVTKALVDPTDVTLTLRSPNGTTSNVATSRSSLGKYFATVTLTTVGTWEYRWLGTGAAAVAGEDKIRVAPTKFAP